MDELIGKYVLFKKSTITGSTGITFKSDEILGRIAAPVSDLKGYYYVRYAVNVKDTSFMSTTVMRNTAFKFVDPETHPEYFL